jgi:hypothetical protein
MRKICEYCVSCQQQDAIFVPSGKNTRSMPRTFNKTAFVPSGFTILITFLFGSTTAIVANCGGP